MVKVPVRFDDRSVHQEILWFGEPSSIPHPHPPQPIKPNPQTSPFREDQYPRLTLSRLTHSHFWERNYFCHGNSLLGVRGLLVYCSAFKCSHSKAIRGDRSIAGKKA